MKLMTLDGNSIINRAFYGIRQLNAPDGTPTNAVYGFIAVLQKLIAEESPDALCVTFDLPAPTFRHERFDGYKAQRKKMPDELAVQLPVMKEVLTAMRIPYYELSGWEADDLLGAIAQKCAVKNWECVIVTGDKDSLQLVSENTRVKHVKSRAGQTETKDYTVPVFTEEYGFEPVKMVDLKALMGDASDNIPGVAGVGEKTALDLIRRFGGILEIYADLDALDIKDSVRKKLEAGRENADMSYELAQIRTDAPIDISIEDTIRKSYDNDSLYALFKKLGFMRFIEKFGLTSSENTASAVKEPAIVEITTADELEKLLTELKTAECVSVRTDPDFSVMAVGSGEKIYVIRRGVTERFDEAVNVIFGGEVKKGGHDVKDTIHRCLERGITTDNWIFDTALAAYLVSPTDSAYPIARISERYCGFTPGASDEKDGQMSLMTDSGKTIAQEAYAIGLLYDALTVKLREMELEKLYYQLEMPLCRVLAEMECDGFLIDKNALLNYGEMLSEGISELEKQIYEKSGETFNINSPKQLGVILFEKLILPAPKKTKTGYSTNAEVLDSLLGKHPIIALIKEYRELTKLKSTYADGLLKVIGHDGRIHTRFQMTVTATGRLSSVEPNLQNIPVRKEIGGELRKMFVAGEGMILVDADYSQIELRLLAHIADDPVMKRAFEQNEDIHTVTASQVFGVSPEDVTSIMRSRAKAVNFGIVYGISAFSLAQDIGVTAKEAKMYIENYLEKYAGVRKYMEDIVEKAKADGYVATLFGRRRYLPELKSGNFNTRSFGERVALNMPIQGTAADIMKLAMINAANALKTAGLSAKIILQVHDELIAECPESEVEAVRRILREEMENAARLNVPLIAEAHAGKNWHDAK